MAENSKSVLLPVMAVAVFAGLGRMVFQKVKADRAARQNPAGQTRGGSGGAGQTRVGRLVGRSVGRGAAGRDRVAGPVDEKTRQWISEVVRTPRQ
ncbi:hypothetical protein [Arthrobacter globiformis]|uniref:Uncharacterized protein n=1 Tax=Arthrobacter globiformis TaxID=1665 RepID=A0A328HCF3_ARTGO|nr:hypothetical protein [Arthrobacter globiformis]RAM36232.1 hypothetical protein DBZ45_15920 [Arthrobacter globiformis]